MLRNRFFYSISVFLRKKILFLLIENYTVMKKIVLILFVGLMVSSFVSCTKSKESKLEGKWRKIHVDNVDAVRPNTIWEFNSGQLVVYTQAVGQQELVEVSKANYTLGFNGATYTFNLVKEVSGKPLNWVLGKGKIVKLNNDQFKYINENGFYAEFVRF